MAFKINPPKTWPSRRPQLLYLYKDNASIDNKFVVQYKDKTYEITMWRIDMYNRLVVEVCVFRLNNPKPKMLTRLMMSFYSKHYFIVWNPTYTYIETEACSEYRDNVLYLLKQKYTSIEKVIDRHENHCICKIGDEDRFILNLTFNL